MAVTTKILSDTKTHAKYYSLEWETLTTAAYVDIQR